MEMNNKEVNEQISNIMTTQVPQSTKVKIEEPDKNTEIVEGLNDSFALKQRLYENVLSPQLKENEKLKREQKRDLMDKLFKILKGQFVATYVFVLAFIIIAAFSKHLQIEKDVITGILDFIKFYITSIVAELIAILFFIVKNVFDTSIVDLFKEFNIIKNDENQNEK